MFKKGVVDVLGYLEPSAGGSEFGSSIGGGDRDCQIAIGCILNCGDPSASAFHDVVHGVLEFMDRELSWGTAVEIYNKTFRVGSATLRTCRVELGV